MTRCRSTPAAIALLVACHGARTDELERRCREAYEASRWQEAAAACERAAAQRDRPDLLVLAARAWQRASQLDKALATAERAFGTSVDATARQVAGIAHEWRNEGELARELLGQAMAAHTAAGDPLELTRDTQALTGVLLRQRRLTEALDVAAVCVGAAQRAGDSRLEGYAHLAQAEAFTAVGDAHAARAAFVDAVAILGKWPRDSAWVLFKHGLLVLELQDPASAVELVTRALEVALRAGVTELVDAAHLNLALAEHTLGHAAAAQRHLDAVPATVRDSASARYVAALVAADRGDTADAERLFALAAEQPPDDDYAWEIAHQRGALAERAQNLASAERFYRSAIAVVEEIRARTSALELRPWMLARRRQPYEALFALLAVQHRDAAALEIAEQVHARTWLDAVVEQAVPRSRSALRGAVSAAAPLSSDGLLATLGGREALIYMAASGALWRIHVDRDRRIALARMPDRVRPLVASFRDRPDDPAVAEQLGLLLVPPGVVASERPLYLIAPDELAELPFAALRRSQRYLIEDRPLVRVPGIAALQCRPTRPSSEDAVVIADARGDLPEARREAEHAAGALHGHAYVGSDATIGRVVSAARARVFHAAVHAGVNGGGGALELTDGRLTGADLITRGIAPAVAVLAGCATAASDDGEGWGALPSALLVAGTQTVVATLRPVLDREAAATIRAFYDAHGDEQPALALAAAQRAQASHAPPRSWASFAAWGHADASECRNAAQPGVR